MSRIELPDFINPWTCERAYMLATIASGNHGSPRAVAEAVGADLPTNARLPTMRAPDWDFFRAGVAAAYNQEPKLLLALEGMLRFMDRASESQYGETRRSTSTPWSHRVEHTEVQIVREALTLASEGYNTRKYASPEEWAKRLQHYGWIYGGAAIVAGLLYPRPYMTAALREIDQQRGTRFAA